MELFGISGLNYVSAAVILLIIAAVIYGYKRGFAKIVLSFAGTLIAIVLILVGGKAVKNMAADLTTLDEKTETFVEQLVDEKMQGSEERFSEMLQEMYLPEKVADKLAAGEYTTYEEQKAEAVSVISDMLFTAGVYVALFILISILIWVLGRIFGLITKIPVLHQMNGLAGAVMELVNVLIVIDIAFLFIAVMSQHSWAQSLLTQIRSGILTSWLYEHNFLLTFMLLKIS